MRRSGGKVAFSDVTLPPRYGFYLIFDTLYLRHLLQRSWVKFFRKSLDFSERAM